MMSAKGYLYGSWATPKLDGRQQLKVSVDLPMRESQMYFCIYSCRFKASKWNNLSYSAENPTWTTALHNIVVDRGPSWSSGS